MFRIAEVQIGESGPKARPMHPDWVRAVSGALLPVQDSRSAEDFNLNSSQKAGCIRRFPASHSCHARRPEYISSAAVVCERPAASRAARTRSGEGDAAGFPRRLLFGWLDTEFARSQRIVARPHPACLAGFRDSRNLFIRVTNKKLTIFLVETIDKMTGGFQELTSRHVDAVLEQLKGLIAGHHSSSPWPQVPRRGVVGDYDSHYTRNACICNNRSSARSQPLVAAKAARRASQMIWNDHCETRRRETGTLRIFE